MNKITRILVDAGHGGIDANGNYTTDASKGKLYYHKTKPSFTIYEGVTNRAIAAKLIHKFKFAGISFFQIHDEVEDISLSKRVQIANDIASRTQGTCLYLSIHSNAGKGKGFEVFTSPGQTKSDKCAGVIIEQLVKDFPEWPFRTDTRDGDRDKEENFTVLTKTKCPAVLVELLFFDERKQAELLMSDAGQERLAESLFKAIKTILKDGV